MSFTNCQAKKRNCNKSKLSKSGMNAKIKVVSKIRLQSQAAMSFTNCQAVKKTCKKENCLTVKRWRNKNSF
jgi:hypothetical protein